MNEPNYKSHLLSFIQEIKKLGNPYFLNPDNWSLSDDLLNGVKIGYSISKLSDRKILHQIGQKHDLIPLCPGDVIDLELGDDIFKPKYAIVRTAFGNLKISPKR